MPDEVESFLDVYDPKVKDTALRVRALIVRCVPDADEKVLRAWKTIAYGRAAKFCAISPHAEWVNLQFHQGARLPDPDGLLEGTGKSMRHVKLRSPGDVRRKALATLVREAANF